MSDTETQRKGTGEGLSSVDDHADARTAEDLKVELAQTKDQLLRALAEAENGRRRAEREAADARVYAIDRFARDLLAVADNLGRAVASGEGPTLLEGVKMTETSLLEVLSRHGVRRVGAKGDKFDPNVHQAVAQLQSDAPAGCVADVFQAGFVLGDRTLRAAMVAVSLGQGGDGGGGGGGDSAPPAGEPGDNVDVKA